MSVKKERACHLMGSKGTAFLSFKRLIINLILDIHHIVTARFTHPLLSCNIYKYYLNYNTICLEHNNTGFPIECINHINKALIVAVKHQYPVKVVEWILNHGSNVHTWNNYTLHYAAKNGYIKIVSLLLDKGADIHSQNDYALRFAAENGHLEVVKLLVDKGANIHICDDEPLCNASHKKHLEIVSFLNDRGANINTLNNAEKNGYLKHPKVARIFKK